MSGAIVVLSHDFSWSASTPVPSLSYVTATAPRGKEAVGLSLSFNAARTNDEKPLLFKLQGVLSSFLHREVGSCVRLPVNCTTSLGTWWCPFFLRGFVGIPHETTCCWFDHVSGPRVPLRPWASPSRSALAWDSAVLFVFGFNSSDFSEPQLGRGGLAPWTGAQEHLCRCLAKVLWSEDTLVFCLRWMGSRGLHISWADAFPPNLGQNS